MSFFAAGIVSVLLTLSTLSVATPESLPRRTVFVHLFEWQWTDVARECEEFLGPRGFAAVQVSPPQEHTNHGKTEWWTRYQPVSYIIESRGGTRQQFQDMVSRCRSVGVDIYVDAVINHMTGVGEGTGWAGSPFHRYSYPAVPYGGDNFHYCGTPGHKIQDYSIPWQVRYCQLDSLTDLATEQPYVQQKIADYLSDLVGMGVSGFRIDAAKHMPPEDLRAILQKVNGNPFVFNEIIPSGPIKEDDYFSIGDVTEYEYQFKIAEHFKQKDKIRWLQSFGEPWGFIRSDKAIVFTDNHDTQRDNPEVLNFGDGKLYELANVFMLAWPYGYPKVMSSFGFSNRDSGPTTPSPYKSSGISCGFHEPWKCEHRWRPIANMVAFRNIAADTFKVTDWWTNNRNAIAFGRGSRGFVVINREDYEISETFQTSMSPGMYCNIIAYDVQNGTCTGAPLTVGGDGRLSVRVPPLMAVAIHAGTRVGGQCPTCPPCSCAPCTCTCTS